MRSGNVPRVTGTDDGGPGKSRAQRAGVEEHLGCTVGGILKDYVGVASLVEVCDRRYMPGVGGQVNGGFWLPSCPGLGPPSRRLEIQLIGESSPMSDRAAGSLALRTAWLRRPG